MQMRKLLFGNLLLLLSATSFSQNVLPSTGPVGINTGTQNLSDLLTISAGTSRKGLTITSDGDAAAYSDIQFRISNPSSTPAGKATNWTISHRKDGYFSGSPAGESSLEFYTVKSGSGYYCPLSFNSDGDVTLVSNKNATSGNVGIGVTNPSTKLDVTGTIRTSNTIVPTDGIGLEMYYYNDQGKVVAFDRTAGLYKGLILNDALYVLGGNTQANRKVGINTGNPQELLSVNGTILSKKVRVSQAAADWPDYVFNKGYNLLSLDSVENFILKNKHLPNVSSAKEVNNNGIDLGENQKALLQKTEELTLYLIEQNKINKTQEKIIEELRLRIVKLENQTINNKNSKKVIIKSKKIIP